MRAGRALAAVLVLLAGCAAPSLRAYTLATPAASAAPSVSSPTEVIEIRHVTIPDALDSEDIVVQSGDELVRSTRGRWASRLSDEVTNALAQQFAQRWPAALVTDDVQSDPPTWRVTIDVARLDIDASGNGVLEADWRLAPRDPKLPVRRGRGRFKASGPVTTDPEKVALLQALLRQLAAAVDLPG
jgi:uncharacterized protein